MAPMVGPSGTFYRDLVDINNGHTGRLENLTTRSLRLFSLTVYLLLNAACHNAYPVAVNLLLEQSQPFGQGFLQFIQSEGESFAESPFGERIMNSLCPTRRMTDDTRLEYDQCLYMQIFEHAKILIFLKIALVPSGISFSHLLVPQFSL